jgi:aminomethyltransferase
MSNKTPLYDQHIAMGAKMVDFAGWEMPLHYGSQIEEHRQVRTGAGMFDVSHMVVSDLKGSAAREFLRRLAANNVDKLRTPGKALYSCMLNDAGGVIDDLIFYFMGENSFRVVTNAATREKDLEWFQNLARECGDVVVTARSDLAMIAVQGPQARTKVATALGEAVREHVERLKPFTATTIGDLFIAATGYTGEDGVEIMVPNERAPAIWQQLAQARVTPAGLGARDTLRLEAGMSLCGADMDESTTPLESGLAWTVAWDPPERQFIGRTALARQRDQGIASKLVGLVLEDKGVLRNHQQVVCDGQRAGSITSGSYSPTLGASVAFAPLPARVEIRARCQVDMRAKMATARIVKLPFVRHGKSYVT